MLCNPKRFVHYYFRYVKIGISCGYFYIFYLHFGYNFFSNFAKKLQKNTLCATEHILNQNWK